MGASDFQLGYKAYWNGNDFDDTRTPEWQRGWLEAEDDDLDSCDYNLEEL